MQLCHTLAGLVDTGLTADIRSVQYDSRRVGPGDLFLAMRGLSVDGNRFIAAAIAQGAAAVLTDLPSPPAASVPIFSVPNGRRALAIVAATLLGHPERQLAISAVTGTNGKTTTAWILEQLLRAGGRNCVLVGTIETHIAGRVLPSDHTTPEASDLLQVFSAGVAEGCTEAVMEMSSHALHQERVWGVPADVAMFTNLTQDHLDYHVTMDAYAAAKARLFAGVGTAPPRVSILNIDDAYGLALFGKGFANAISYGLSAQAYSRAEDVIYAAGHTQFTWVYGSARVPVTSPLMGKVNVYNLLAAASAALARGLTMEQVAAAIPALEQVPGRFQTVPNAQGLTVVVDYAHTDDALRNLLAAARSLAPVPARIITLFGCGGDRDPGKRRKMGRAAADASDLVILTSDNPRTEDPAAIIAQALEGVRQTATACLVEPDRATAIGLAIRHARIGDIVLLAGKGHEKVQILATGTIAFDDVAVAANHLHAHAATQEPQ